MFNPQVGNSIALCFRAWMVMTIVISIFGKYSVQDPTPSTFTYVKWSEVTQSCPTLCDPMDCSPPGSSIRGILQARILEWAAISFSRGSSQPRDRTWVSCIAGRCFNHWGTREATYVNPSNSYSPMTYYSLLHTRKLRPREIKSPFQSKWIRELQSELR